MDEKTITNGEFLLSIEGDERGRVYRNGELLGHFWKDKYEGYAVFRHGDERAVARPKTVRGCVLALTNREWDGRPGEDPPADDPAEPTVITFLRKLVRDKQAKKWGGVLVDAFTASMILAVHDALKPENRAKLAAMPLQQMAAVAYTLARR